MRRTIERCLAAAALLVVGVVLLCPATDAAAARSTCNEGGGLLGREETPSELLTPLEEAITSKYGVLRRPASASDALPPLSQAGSELDDELGSFYPTEVRLVRSQPDGVRYFLVPGFPQAATIPPAPCLPRPLRSERTRLVEEQRRHEHELVYCIARLGGARQGFSGEACTAFADVDENLRAFESGFDREPVVELVPDGVASVRVVYRRAPTAVLAVSENTYLLTPPGGSVTRVERAFFDNTPGERRLTPAQRRKRQAALAKLLRKALAEATPSKVEWLDAAGAVVHVATPPRHVVLTTIVSVSSG